LGREITENLVKEVSRSVREKIRQDASRVNGLLATALVCLADLFLEEGFSVKTWFEKAGIKGKSASTRFSQALGITPKVYLDLRRFEVALSLIEILPKAPFHQISEAVGYSMESSFYVAFKRYFGRTPKQVRKALAARSMTKETLLERAQARKRHRSPEANQSIEFSLTSEETANPNRDFDEVSARFFENVLWECLGDLGPDEQRMLLCCGFKFQTTALFQHLMKVSVEECRGDRKVGVEIADLAIHALNAVRHRLSTSDFLALRVEALANLGNTQRLATDWSGADKTFAVAEIEMSGSIVPDETEALLCAYQGTLRLHQRRFAEAMALLEQAHIHYKSCGNEKKETQTLIAMGQCLELQGKARAAIAIYKKILNKLKSSMPTSFYLEATILSRLSTAYCSLEKYERAERFLDEAAVILQRNDALEDTPGVIWLRGLLHREAGNQAKAEEDLVKCKAKMTSAGDIGNAALVEIDLGILHFDRMEYGKAEAAAASAIPVLKSLSLPEETFAAISVAANAVARRRLTRESLRALRRELEVQLNAPTVERADE